ncbi:hypothetical protein Aca07nite_72330 [Actinoplanes capillaceus]|uniref:Uncharacterized protein n=1 Tax=Actinoplanes campanulatus TaxID=113559 RepID=A0ABQ3WUU5_9ACTN|nr:hypothetical protein Aca07nite_72330 [Actinoplanes capillaceus]
MLRTATHVLRTATHVLACTDSRPEPFKVDRPGGRPTAFSCFTAFPVFGEAEGVTDRRPLPHNLPPDLLRPAAR